MLCAGLQTHTRVTVFQVPIDGNPKQTNEKRATNPKQTNEIECLQNDLLGNKNLYWLLRVCRKLLRLKERMQSDVLSRLDNCHFNVIYRGSLKIYGFYD